MRRGGFELCINKNAGLSGSFDANELEFVEREATPQLLMRLRTRLYLSEISLSYTVMSFYIFGVQRVQSTVHNWGHKADVQPQE